MIKRIRFWAPIAIVALLASALTAAPAAATGDGGSGLFGEDSPGGTIADEGDDSGDGEEPVPDEDVLDEVLPEGPQGPVGSVDVLSYEALWVPGGIVPSEVRVLQDDEDVDLLIFAPDDGSSLMALLVISSEDAATEHRFENAVPAGHSAELQPDGSVKFFDDDGNEAGAVLAPWALDSLGESVATSYRLDGTTLTQTIDHEGATYPVVADPTWVRACAAIPACVDAAVTVARFVPLVVVSAWNRRGWLGTGDGSGGNRPTNSCNMRNRNGC
ncbi:hypothetical protein [Candidatus Poriferisodalis sp.]|uniref:hypothetical protein n=1 Tax=Candidatus Poriferisodalis sp. TaxID=3101277 RepID=UPI003B5C1820